jgi:hypothetical protein
MSGFYARNPHDDAGNDIEAAERQERAEAAAGSWFKYATKPQHQTFADIMANAKAFKDAPKWERVRRAAERQFARTTQEAAALCAETVTHFLANGEVLEELADRWEALAAKTNAAAADFSLQAAE